MTSRASCDEVRTCVNRCASRDLSSGYVRPSQRSRDVSFLQRASHAVWGAPGMIRANGGRGIGLLSRIRSQGALRRRRQATPVFALDVVNAADGGRLPRIWLSERVYDEKTGEYAGREFSSAYPSADFDKSGSLAYDLGMELFAEGLGYSASEDAPTRISCFRAAEILFLHSARRGHVEALVKLGIIYESDLGEGRYWDDGVHLRSEHSTLMEGIGDSASRVIGLSCYRDLRAAECFMRAADHGNAEAYWRLGDMAASGRCGKLGPVEAVSLYYRSFQAATRTGDMSHRGCAAVRIACSYEDGIGCVQSFKRAYAWFCLAEDDLLPVVEKGGWYYKRSLLKASTGLRRVRQELIGGF